MLVGGKWFWCCKDNIIFPLRHHRTARVFPTPRAFSVRPPHSARSVASNCAHHPSILLHLIRTFLRLSPAFLLTFSTRRGKHRALSTQSSPFFIQSSPFSCIYSRVLLRASHSTPALCHSLHFSAPSTVGDRSETHKFHLLMHHILRRRCAFPLPLSQSPVISPHHAPLASSSRLLRFQTFPSTRPIPPHTSVFSGSFIHNYPLPQVVNPTFLPTYRRHIFET